MLISYFIKSLAAENGCERDSVSNLNSNSVLSELLDSIIDNWCNF